MFARVGQRLPTRGAHHGGTQVGAGNEQGTAARDERAIYQACIERHVGAVFTVKKQREGVLVLQAEQHQTGQALRVDLHLRGVTTLTLQCFGEEAPHLFVTHTRQHGCAHPEAGNSKSDVGGAAAQVFRKTRHVFQACAELLRVQVYGEPTKASQVVLAALGNGQAGHADEPNCRGNCAMQAQSGIATSLDERQTARRSKRMSRPTNVARRAWASSSSLGCGSA